MNIGVAIVSTRKWKLASFSRSVLIFGASPARFVALMNIESPSYRRSSQKTKGAGLGPHNSAQLIAVVGNHPVFRWFTSLHLFKLLLRMHRTSQGLILSLCSNQQHLYSAEMSKFDHDFRQRRTAIRFCGTTHATPRGAR